MKNSKANNLSITEGLVRIEYFERDNSIPYADDAVHIVVMKHAENSLQHYKTLRKPTDRISIGESLGREFAFFYVDMKRRHLRIDQKYRFIDIPQGIRVVAELTYQVKDAEKVVLTGDALSDFRSRVNDLFKEEFGLLTLQDIKNIETIKKIIHDKISLATNEILEQTGLHITHIYFDIYLQESALAFLTLSRAQTVKFDDNEISSYPDDLYHRLEGNSTTDAPPPDIKKKKRKGKK